MTSTQQTARHAAQASAADTLAAIERWTRLTAIATATGAGAMVILAGIATGAATEYLTLKWSLQQAAANFNKPEVTRPATQSARPTTRPTSPRPAPTPSGATARK